VKIKDNFVVSFLVIFIREVCGLCLVLYPVLEQVGRARCSLGSHCGVSENCMRNPVGKKLFSAGFKQERALLHTMNAGCFDIKSL
jgi:hypothetical protein